SMATVKPGQERAVRGLAFAPSVFHEVHGGGDGGVSRSGANRRSVHAGILRVGRGGCFCTYSDSICVTDPLGFASNSLCAIDCGSLSGFPGAPSRSWQHLRFSPLLLLAQSQGSTSGAPVYREWLAVPVGRSD